MKYFLTSSLLLLLPSFLFKSTKYFFLMPEKRKDPEPAALGCERVLGCALGGSEPLLQLQEPECAMAHWVGR